MSGARALAAVPQEVATMPHPIGLPPLMGDTMDMMVQQPSNWHLHQLLNTAVPRPPRTPRGPAGGIVDLIVQNEAALQKIILENDGLRSLVQKQHEALMQKLDTFARLPETKQLLEPKQEHKLGSELAYVGDNSTTLSQGSIQEVVSEEIQGSKWAKTETGSDKNADEEKQFRTQKPLREVKICEDAFMADSRSENNLSASMSDSSPTSPQRSAASSMSPSRSNQALEQAALSSSLGKSNRHIMKHIYKRQGFLKDDYTPNALTRIAEGCFFRNFINVLIILNSVFIGVEMQIGMQRALDGKSSLNFDVLEIAGHLFTFFFTLELCFRVPGYKMHFWLGQDWQWNVFDFIIVFLALAELFLSGLAGFSALRALRALRLAKTLRILRVVSMFRNLTLILQSLLASLLSLVWMLILLMLAMYLVSIVFMGAAGQYLVDVTNSSEEVLSALSGDDMPHDEIHSSFERDFRTVPRAMLTMFFSVTGGKDWYDILQPLLIVSWMYGVVFIAFQVFVVFGVFNVLNAVFVESVLDNRDKDLLIQNEQSKTKAFMCDVAELFNEESSDGDNSAPFPMKELTMDALAEHCAHPRFCTYLNSYGLDATDAKTLFTIMDADHSGTINVEEFVEGALRLKGPARCLDIIKIQAAFLSLNKQMEGIQKVVKKFESLGQLTYHVPN